MHIRKRETGSKRLIGIEHAPIHFLKLVSVQCCPTGGMKLSLQLRTVQIEYCFQVLDVFFLYWLFVNHDLESRILQVFHGLGQEAQERIGSSQTGTCGTSVTTTDYLFSKSFQYRFMSMKSIQILKKV